MGVLKVRVWVGLGVRKRAYVKACEWSQDLEQRNDDVLHLDSTQSFNKDSIVFILTDLKLIPTMGENKIHVNDVMNWMNH